MNIACRSAISDSFPASSSSAATRAIRSAATALMIGSAMKNLVEHSERRGNGEEGRDPQRHALDRAVEFGGVNEGHARPSIWAIARLIQPSRNFTCVGFFSTIRA